jgi:hypothetical protein
MRSLRCNAVTSVQEPIPTRTCPIRISLFSAVSLQNHLYIICTFSLRPYGDRAMHLFKCVRRVRTKGRVSRNVQCAMAMEIPKPASLVTYSNVKRAPKKKEGAGSNFRRNSKITQVAQKKKKRQTPWSRRLLRRPPAPPTLYARYYTPVNGLLYAPIQLLLNTALLLVKLASPSVTAVSSELVQVLFWSPCS